MAIACVVDASAAFEHLLMFSRHKASDFHNLIPFKESEVIMSYLCHAEVRHTLLSWKRSKKLSHSQFTECIDKLNSMNVHTDIYPDWKWTVELAEKHSLTVYDALYLELAMTLAKSYSVVLATFDKALVIAAKAEGIPLLYQRN